MVILIVSISMILKKAGGQLRRSFYLRMGRDDGIYSKMVHFLDDREFVDKVDSACSLLGWSRAGFLRAASRVYFELALSQVAKLENNLYDAGNKTDLGLEVGG